MHYGKGSSREVWNYGRRVEVNEHHSPNWMQLMEEYYEGMVRVQATSCLQGWGWKQNQFLETQVEWR